MKRPPPVMTTLVRPTSPLAATRADLSRFLRRPDAFGQCFDGLRAMRHRVLLGQGHLCERLRRAIRDEDRIETESAAPALPLWNRPAAFPMEDLVVVRRPQEEHGLEPSRTVSGPVQQLQDACTAEALVYVR